MTRQVFLTKLDSLLELDPGTLKGPEELTSIVTWDSLALMSFIALVHREFAVRLPGKQIATCKTVDDLLRFVDTHLQG